MNDEAAWKKYPHHRLWFNKLWLSEQFGYYCGPGGVAPQASNYYIVRPIYNLAGMGVGAEYRWIEEGDYSVVPPGYFWCEIFIGKHISAQYQWNDNQLTAVSGWLGQHLTTELYKFNRWTRVDINDLPSPPPICNRLMDVQQINIEFIDNKPIEIHLRETPDPQYDQLFPVFTDMHVNHKQMVDNGYKWIDSYDNADGFLDNPRIGFYVR